MIDLRCRYLGLDLRSPLVASASPLAQTVEGVRRLAEGGVAAVVLPSLFEEQLQREAARFHELAEAGSESFAESLSYLPPSPVDQDAPHRYLSLVERAAAAVDVPIIGSLNGVTPGGWVRYARSIQDAGAGAIELNVYHAPGPPSTSGRDVEDRTIEVVAQVKAAVSVPVAVKLGPFWSSVGEFALRLDDAGADALVLFNRFLQPEIDPETLTTRPSIDLSSPVDARLAATWVSLLHGRVRAQLAASSGVEGAADVARYLLAGADVVMTTSALMRHGPEHAGALLQGLTEWMAGKGYASLADVRGIMRVPAAADASAYERAGYVSMVRPDPQRPPA
jgi:dihydroorotate dehydrogenase (fumarate)